MTDAAEAPAHATAPAHETPPTSESARQVSEALSRLEELDGMAVEGHAPIYEAIHAILNETLQPPARAMPTPGARR